MALVKSNTRISFTWDRITVEIKEKRKTNFWRSRTDSKLVLQGISGSVCGPCFVAIVGESGSGKTTFLSAISGRYKGKLGSILIDNQVASNENIKNISGFIHQQDLFTDSLTVFEYLQFIAAMQLADQSKIERLTTINKYTNDLNLDTHKDTIIKYLSGGEKRRLSLAAQLLSDPLLLFCDEPTTGLDSYSAIVVIQLLKQISATGKLVLTTIHQPSSQIFDCFDIIIILAGGRLVCQGNKEQVKNFFVSLNLPCPKTYNPADHFLKCVTIPSGDEYKKVLVNQMVHIFGKQKVLGCQCNVNHLRLLKEIVRNGKPDTNFCYNLKWLLWRNSLDTRRKFNQHLIAYLLLIISTLTITLSYSFVQLQDSDSVQNIQGVLLLIVSELIFTNMYAVIYVFPGETAIFLRESHLYSIYPYFLSKLLSVIPICIINSLSFLVVYFLTLKFLNGYLQFFRMFYVLFVTCLAACALGLSFSTTITSVEYVDLILIPIEMFVMLMSGIWIKIDTLSSYIHWVKYLSPFFYAFESISVLYWGNVKHIVDCNKNNNGPTNQMRPCFQNGDEVLASYGFLRNYNIVPYNILYLHVLILFYCIIGFLGIIKKKRSSNIL